MAVVIPTIIQGPAILTWKGVSFYSKKGFKVSHERETFKVGADTFGTIDERLKSEVFKISWEPDGQIENTANFIKAYYPYLVADIGKSIFGRSVNSTTSDAVVVWTMDGRKITWTRGSLTKMPALMLGPTKTPFGTMEITVIGKASAQRTAADYWKTITSASFADATFDETLIKTQAFTATFGASPYDAMGSMEGFEVNIDMGTQTILGDDVGVADIILTDLTAGAKFRPSNLTEAQIDTLLMHSGTGALEIGESLSKSNTNLVIASAGLSVTIYKAGAKKAEENFAMGTHLHGQLEFTSKRTWTTGTANELYAVSVL